MVKNYQERLSYLSEEELVARIAFSLEQSMLLSHGEEAVRKTVELFAQKLKSS